MQRFGLKSRMSPTRLQRPRIHLLQQFLRMGKFATKSKSAGDKPGVLRRPAAGKAAVSRAVSVRGSKSPRSAVRRATLLLSQNLLMTSLGSQGVLPQASLLLPRLFQSGSPRQLLPRSAVRRDVAEVLMQNLPVLLQLSGALRSL